MANAQPQLPDVESMDGSDSEVSNEEFAIFADEDRFIGAYHIGAQVDKLSGSP